MESLVNVPRISGHHFADLLSCPEKVWMNYHGDDALKAEFPSDVIIRLKEGRAFEKRVYQELYPDALEIPQHVLPGERKRQTTKAMQSGASHIRQAYLSTDEGVGVVDILEKTGTDPESSTGYSYRVGEIKHSEEVRTEHVLQVAWYNDLLRHIYGQQQDFGFVVLKDTERTEIDLRSLWPDFLRFLETLRSMRVPTAAPGPHLCSHCRSCSWRTICLPEIKESDHLSMVSGIDRHTAACLRGSGFSAWTDLLPWNDSNVTACGVDQFRMVDIRAGITRLEKGAPPFLRPIDLRTFSTAALVTFDYSEGQDRSDSYPATIHVETGNTTKSFSVADQKQSPFGVGREKLVVVYGERDESNVRSILRQAGVRRSAPTIRDLLAFIDLHVHVPLVDRSLEAVLNHIHDGIPSGQAPTGLSRLSAIREVLNWIVQE